jgi:hypothetical protein
MKHTTSSVITGLIVAAGFVMAQTPIQTPPPAYPNHQAPPPAAQASAQNQMNMQMLGEMLRTAATFHDFVRSMNISQALGPDPHTIGPDGKLHHSMDRTAETIGAGAGVGAALGAMSHSQNGVMIGALIGGASGLIIDQIVKQHEQQQARAVVAPAPDTHYAPPPHREFKTRDSDADRDRQAN